MLICYSLLPIASLLLIATTPSSAANISEVGGTRNNGYFALNRQIQFNCVYDNNVFVFVSFGHNGSRISPGGRFYIQDSDPHHSLVVSNTVPSDSGTWSCTLRSLQDHRTITRTTIVTYEESIVLTPTESSVVGAYGRPYTITCRGENIRMWQWIHDDAVVANSSDGRVQVWSNGRLHFTSLQYEDTGVYYCKAANFYDFDEIATYRLTVDDLPEVTVVKQPSNVIKANDSLNITCMASGVGLGSVTWSKESDGGQLTNNGDHSVTIVFQNATTIISVLRFTAVTGSQQDTYRCNATNAAGSSYEFTEVNLSGLPGAPPPPSLSVINVTIVRVRWESPDDTGNFSISHFQVNYGKVGERGNQSPIQLELPAHHMEYDFSLLLATRYYFSVAAMNDHGRGPFSEQNEITTNSTIPDALTIMATNVTTAAVLLSWQSLTGNNTGGVPITGYVITYYYTSGSPVTEPIDISEADNDSYWLTGLMDNAEYHVMMCAMNINGCGEQSSLIDFMTLLSLPAFPVTPGNAVAVEIKQSSVLLEWSYGDDDKSQISHFQVERRQFGRQNWTVIATVGALTTTQANATGLYPFTAYQFRVLSVNNNNVSSPSEPSELVVTREAAPTATPINVKVVDSNDNAIVVTWEHPPLRLEDGTGRNGIIISYEVNYTLVGSSRDTVIVHTNSNATMIIISGLEVYEVSIAAITSQGIGPATVVRLPTVDDNINGSNSSSSGIIGGAVGGVIAVLIMITVVLCVVILCTRRSLKKEGFHVYDEISTKLNTNVIFTNKSHGVAKEEATKYLYSTTNSVPTMPYSKTSEDKYDNIQLNECIQHSELKETVEMDINPSYGVSIEDGAVAFNTTVTDSDMSAHQLSQQYNCDYVHDESGELHHNTTTTTSRDVEDNLWYHITVDQSHETKAVVHSPYLPPIAKQTDESEYSVINQPQCDHDPSFDTAVDQSHTAEFCLPLITNNTDEGKYGVINQPQCDKDPNFDTTINEGKYGVINQPQCDKDPNFDTTVNEGKHGVINQPQCGNDPNFDTTVNQNHTTESCLLLIANNARLIGEGKYGVITQPKCDDPICDTTLDQNHTTKSNNAKLTGEVKYGVINQPQCSDPNYFDPTIDQRCTSPLPYLPLIADNPRSAGECDYGVINQPQCDDAI